MFQRSLFPENIEKVISDWKIINEYPDDKPYPSILLLGHIKDIPIHVVLGIDYCTKTGYIITVYKPYKKIWTDDFTQRR